jgi:site-specific DNA-methyltransferase (adenine-specific)
MKPYYSNDKVELYCCDCRDIIPHLPERSFAALITDPPYGKVVAESWDDLSHQQLSGLLQGVLQDMRPALKLNGTVAMFCYPAYSHRLQNLMEGMGWHLLGEVVWRKGLPCRKSQGRWCGADFSRQRRPFTESERIVFCCMPEAEQEWDRQCAQIRGEGSAQGVFTPLIDFFRSAFKKSGIKSTELREYMKQQTGTRYTFEKHTLSHSQWQFPTWEQFDAAADILPELCRVYEGDGYHETHRAAYETLRAAYETHRRPWTAGRRTFTDIWEYSAIMPGGYHRHPCAKPVELMADLIKLITRPGDLICDPFGGGGATAEAALLSGRRCVIIERDERYAGYIAERLNGLLSFTGGA